MYAEREREGKGKGKGMPKRAARGEGKKKKCVRGVGVGAEWMRVWLEGCSQPLRPHNAPPGPPAGTARVYVSSYYYKYYLCVLILV